MGNRSWIAIAGLACALLCTWVAIDFLRETPGDAPRDGTASANAAAARAAADRDAIDARDAAREDVLRRDLTPTVVAVEPRLEWPDAASLRRLEQRGRALFGGVVFAPDGSPCPGASVWCGGAVIATTDDHGAWRADVVAPIDPELEGGRPYFDDKFPSSSLAARKEGVGYAEADLTGGSRRIDLRLQRGFTFGGRVVDNDDLHPVAGAELHARVGWFDDETKADGLGRFAFPDLPNGGLDLSGRAPGFDSNGTFPFNFDRGRDVEITFRLTRAFRLRGRFAPWPSPGVAPTQSSVVLVTRSPHSHDGNPTLSGEVGSDGAFDLPLPVCPVATLSLTVGGGTIWRTDVDVNEEKHDVDLGRIELDPPAAVVGRVELPAGLDRSAVTVEASVAASGGPPATLHVTLSSDGSFRLAPLPAGPVGVTVRLGQTWLASLDEASGLSSAERDGSFELAVGETRDVGVIVPTVVLFYGTVRDARGEPVATAKICEGIHFPEGTPRPRYGTIVMTWSDEDGRFRCVFFELGEELHAPYVEVHARGFAPRRFEVELQKGVTSICRDFVLGDGGALRGTLVDESDAPLAGWSIRVEPADTPDDLPDDRASNDRTQADGSFEVRGLEAGEYKLYARPLGGTTVKFAKIHPEQGEVTLRISDAVAVAATR